MRRLLVAASLAGCASLVGVGDLTVEDAGGGEAAAPSCGWPGPDAGLLAYYAFDEDAGAIVHDCSGNDQQGTFATVQTGWAPLDGHLGGALAVDANGNGCVELPLSLSPESATFSVSAWVTPSAYPQDFDTIIGHHGNGSDDRGWRVEMRTTDAGSFLAFRVFALDGGDYEALGPPMAINDGWHHLVATYSEGAAVSLTLDDASVKAPPPPPILPEGQAIHIRIGCRGDFAYAYPFVGKIAEVRIYDHVLDAGEIAELGK